MKLSMGFSVNNTKHQLKITTISLQHSSRIITSLIWLPPALSKTTFHPPNCDKSQPMAYIVDTEKSCHLQKVSRVYHTIYNYSCQLNCVLNNNICQLNCYNYSWHLNYLLKNNSCQLNCYNYSFYLNCLLHNSCQYNGLLYHNSCQMNCLLFNTSCQ